LNGTFLEPARGDAAVEAGEAGIAGRVLAGEDCDLDPLARLDGPLVIGQGCSVGAGARIRHSVLLPGAQVAPETIVAGGVHGRAGNLA
jgi:NDP-sugar pyrophosphorylase family protein